MKDGVDDVQVDDGECGAVEEEEGGQRLAPFVLRYADLGGKSNFRVGRRVRRNRSTTLDELVSLHLARSVKLSSAQAKWEIIRYSDHPVLGQEM